MRAAYCWLRWIGWQLASIGARLPGAALVLRWRAIWRLWQLRERRLKWQ